MITPKLLLHNQFYNVQDDLRNTLLLNVLDYLSEDDCKDVIDKCIPDYGNRIEKILEDWREAQLKAESENENRN